MDKTVATRTRMLQYCAETTQVPTNDQPEPVRDAGEMAKAIADLGAKYVGDVRNKHRSFTRSVLGLIVAERFVSTAALVSVITPSLIAEAADVMYRDINAVLQIEEAAAALERLSGRVMPFLPVKVKWLGDHGDLYRKHLTRLIVYAAERAALNLFEQPIEATTTLLFVNQRRRASLARFTSYRERHKSKIVSYRERRKSRFDAITDEMLMAYPCSECGAGVGEPCGPSRRRRGKQHTMRAVKGPRMKACIEAARAGKASTEVSR